MRLLNQIGVAFFSHTNVVLLFLQMSALKSANKELKGMMKTVRIQDIDVSSNHLVLASLVLFKPLFERFCVVCRTYKMK